MTVSKWYLVRAKHAPLERLWGGIKGWEKRREIGDGGWGKRGKKKCR